jgi:hypothetical protein
MKNQLNEQLSRIKQMMGSIQEQSFEMKKEEGPSDEVKQKVFHGLEEFAKDGAYNDAQCDLSDGYFEIPLDDSGDEFIRYRFDVDVTGWPSFTPGRSFMSNGDVGYPDEGEPLEWGPENVTIEVISLTRNQDGNWDENTIYEGKDFTNFLDYRLTFKGSGGDGGTWIYNMFEEDLFEKAMNRY